MKYIKKCVTSKILIPEPTILRLCKLYSLLDEMSSNGVTIISSREIGIKLGVGAHNIRKDIGYLGETGTSGSGYEITKLRDSIQSRLGIEKPFNACVVGLGKLGTALINKEIPMARNMVIVAGFDASTNRLETIRTEVQLHPMYQIEDIIAREKIDLAILTVPDDQVQAVGLRLARGGIKGIVNFTPVELHLQNEPVFIRNIDVMSEFRFISALMHA